MVRQAIMGEDVTAMRSATEDLKNTFSQVGAAMYQQGAQDEGAQNASAPPNGATDTGNGTGDQKPPNGDDVVEGEFRETK